MNMKSSTDSLTYTELNEIEQMIYDLGQRIAREYTKTNWILGQEITSTLFSKIENELSYYNDTYNLGYTMKNWEELTAMGTATISYLDINRWLEIIEKMKGIIVKYAGELRTSQYVLEIINKEV